MSEVSRSSQSYRHYVLGLLLLGYVINFIDRSILSILLEPIKYELELSDSELGFFRWPRVCLVLCHAGYSDRRSRGPMEPSQGLGACDGNLESDDGDLRNGE